MTRRALLIGCSEFDDPAYQTLAYPTSDATRLGAVLADESLCFFDDVQILENPTQRNARRAVELMARTAAPNDLILLFYSGHGSLDRDGSLALILPETEQVVLGSTSLGSTEIKQYFNISRAGQKVIILDCCYSGALGEDRMKGDANGTIDSLARETTGTFILTASTRFQPALESKALESGILTNCLLDGIVHGRAAPNAAEITLSSLAAYAKLTVPRYGAQQPQYWDLGSTGEVVIAKCRPSFDGAWRRRASQAVARHQAEGHIAYDMAEEVRAAIAAPNDNKSFLAKQLIDQLVKKEVGLGPFAVMWTRMRSDGVTIEDVSKQNASTDAGKRSGRQAGEKERPIRIDDNSAASSANADAGSTGARFKHDEMFPKVPLKQRASEAGPVDVVMTAGEAASGGGGSRQVAVDEQRAIITAKPFASFRYFHDEVRSGYSDSFLNVALGLGLVMLGLVLLLSFLS